MWERSRLYVVSQTRCRNTLTGIACWGGRIQSMQTFPSIARLHCSRAQQNPPPALSRNPPFTLHPLRILYPTDTTSARLRNLRLRRHNLHDLLRLPVTQTPLPSLRQHLLRCPLLRRHSPRPRCQLPSLGHQSPLL